MGANFVALQDERTLQTSMLTLSCFVLYFLADVCWIALHPASVPPGRDPRARLHKGVLWPVRMAGLFC